MKVSSVKAKGRRLQQWVSKWISKITKIPCGKDCLIESREMGQSGVDVKLIGEAKKLYPFSVECKNTEKWDLPRYIHQAKENCMPGTYWQVFLSKNRFSPIVIMDAECFFRLWKRYLKMKQRKNEN